MSPRSLLLGLVFLIFLVVVGLSIQAMQFEFFLSTDWIDSSIRERGFVGKFLLVTVGAALIAVGLPRHVIAFLAGYGLGFNTGLILALAATILGCIITFSFSRYLGRDLVARKFPARIRRIDDFLTENTFSMTLLIRFLPAGSNVITNLAAGVSKVAAFPFIAGSAIGYIPQTAVFALVGSGMEVEPLWRISLSIVLFLVCGGLGLHLYRRYYRVKKLDDKNIKHHLNSSSKFNEKTAPRGD